MIVAALVLFLNFQTFTHILGRVVVNLNGQSHGNTSAIKFLSFCSNCPDPEKEGSLLQGLIAKFGRQDFSVTGELIYCVPNLVDKKRVLNADQLEDKIAFIERGSISLLQKVLRIQQQSKASGIVVADDGTCDELFHYCGPRAGSVFDGGFAAFDDKHLWETVNLPVIIVTAQSAKRLRTAMEVEQVLVRGSGLQKLTKTRIEL